MLAVAARFKMNALRCTLARTMAAGEIPPRESLGVETRFDPFVPGRCQTQVRSVNDRLA
jgi:hypothetical protein